MTDSNKVATPATDEQVAASKAEYESFLSVSGALQIHKEATERALALVSRIESDRLSLAEKEIEIQRLRGLCGKAFKWMCRMDFIDESIKEPLLSELDRASKETI